MNTKKIFKIAIQILVILLLVSIATPIFAATSGSGAPDPSDKYRGDSGFQTTKIDTIGNQIIRVVSVVGSIISVVVLVALGIKYMMGSAEEKAEYKKTMLPYILGAILVFAASSIAGVIFGFAQNF